MDDLIIDSTIDFFKDFWKHLKIIENPENLIVSYIYTNWRISFAYKTDNMNRMKYWKIDSIENHFLEHL